MTDLAAVDYFSDAGSQPRIPTRTTSTCASQGPVFREPHHGVVAVTGYQEVMAAFKDRRLVLGGQRDRRPVPAVAVRTRR